MPRPKRHPEEPALAVAFGRVIREERRRAGMMAYQLAEKLGVSAQAVTAWERGNTIPVMPHLMVLCRMLDIRMSALVARAEAFLSFETIKPGDDKDEAFEMFGRGATVRAVADALVEEISVVGAWHAEWLSQQRIAQ